MEALYFIIPVIALIGLFFLFWNGLPIRAFDTMPESSVKSSVFNGIVMLLMATIYLFLNEGFFSKPSGIEPGLFFRTFTNYIDFLAATLNGLYYYSSGANVGYGVRIATLYLVPAIYVFGAVRAFKMRKYVEETNRIVGGSTLRNTDEPFEPEKYRWWAHAIIYPTTLIFLPAVLIGVVFPIVMTGVGIFILLVMLGAFGMLMKGSGIRIGIRHR